MNILNMHLFGLTLNLQRVASRKHADVGVRDECDFNDNDAS